MIRRIVSTGTIIKEYLKENKISQKRLADLTGYTEKQVSCILNDKSPVTQKFAIAMQESIDGFKADFILNYYQAYKKQCEDDAAFLQRNNYSLFAKRYSLKKVFKHINNDPVEQIHLIKEAFDITELSELSNYLVGNQLYKIVAFSKDSSKLGDKDNELVKIWTQLIMKQMTLGEEKKVFVGRKEAKRILSENKELLNVTDSEDLMANIRYICDLCGIHIGFSRSAPTTYIRGLSFSSDGQLFIVLTDRFKKIEYVVFAFIHELMHIINGDVVPETQVILIDDGDVDAEDEADKCAREFLIPQDVFSSLGNLSTVNLSSIFRLAEQTKCSIGLVVSRIHYETRDYTRFWQYLHSFSLENDMFGN